MNESSLATFGPLLGLELLHRAEALCFLRSALQAAETQFTFKSKQPRTTRDWCDGRRHLTYNPGLTFSTRGRSTCPPKPLRIAEMIFSA